MTADELLIRSADLVGQTVNDADGGKLAVIREVYLDRESGVARFVALESAGIFGGGGKYHPVPWRLLKYDETAQGYVAALSKERLKSAPAYDRDQLSSTTYGWSELVERFFGAAA